MAGKPELNATDVERALKACGFTPRPQKSTSHRHWVHENFRGQFRKVTVDAHHQPFSPDLVSSMAHQMGVSKKEFYALCSKDGAKKAKRGLFFSR